jgi:hypothetical protein
MSTIQVTKQFTAGPLNGISVTETVITNFPNLWVVGTERIDYITEIPYNVTNVEFINKSSEKEKALD